MLKRRRLICLPVGHVDNERTLSSLIVETVDDESMLGRGEQVGENGHEREESTDEPDRSDHDAYAPRFGRILFEIGERVGVRDAQIAIDAHAAQVENRGGREEHVTSEPEATCKRAQIPIAAEKLDGIRRHG